MESIPLAQISLEALVNYAEALDIPPEIKIPEPAMARAAARASVQKQESEKVQVRFYRAFLDATWI